MIRTNDSKFRGALSADDVTILPIVHLDFKDDPVYGWGGIGELVWDSKTWLGVGNMAEISRIKTDSKGAIPSLDLSLLGIEPAMLAIAEQNKYRGRRARLWLGCFNDAMQLIGSPVLYFAGEISNMSLVDGRDRRIRVTIDSRMALLKQNKPRYRTDEDQQRRSAGDRFFSFVPSLGNRTLYWGLKTPANYSYSGGGGSGGGGFGSGRGGIVPDSLR